MASILSPPTAGMRLSEGKNHVKTSRLRQIAKNNSATDHPPSVASSKKRAAEEDARGDVLPKKAKAGKTSGSGSPEAGDLPTYDGKTGLPAYDPKPQTAKSSEVVKLPTTSSKWTGTIAAESTLSSHTNDATRPKVSIAAATPRASFPANGTALVVRPAPTDFVEFKGIYDHTIIDEPAFDALMDEERKKLMFWSNTVGVF